jgi:cyclopropane-fatty-acyl-phospholipid synthase
MAIGFGVLTINEAMPIPATLSAITHAADVRFNGDRPWDPQVHNPALYPALLRDGSMALGNGYVRGDWDCEQLDECICRLLRGQANRPLSLQAQLTDWGRVLADLLVNPQTLRRSYRVGRRHYDIDPRVYAAMLDPLMAYSCGYWRDARDLATAQEHKCRLICEKLQLRPGMRLLDVGCGWGSLAAYAARHYGVEVEQCDYRQLPARAPGCFDRIASVGMFEHVGRRNDRNFFSTMARLLDAEGLLLLHTIGSAFTTRRIDPWIDAYIFPGGRLPSAMQLARGVEGVFLIEDWENFGLDYDRTLLAWWQNFEAAWPVLQHDSSTEFFRFWRYYLLSCAGFFRSRQGQLWQLVLSKPGRSSTYRSWRPVRQELNTAAQHDAAKPEQHCFDVEDATSSHWRIEGHHSQPQ